jgi:hypothetical protein
MSWYLRGSASRVAIGEDWAATNDAEPPERNGRIPSVDDDAVGMDELSRWPKLLKVTARSRFW